MGKLSESEQSCCAVDINDPLYVAYHDMEWGVPVYDDQQFFEKICLEGFQAGLSWKSILHRREAFRAAFEVFRCEETGRLYR